MSAPARPYGLMAQFTSPEELVDAVRRARDAGYTRMDTYTPFPIEDMPDTLGLKKSPVPLVALVGGVLGAGGAYFMLWYSAVIDYPWNIGGRPLHSWPSFIPITFELGVLAASLSILTAVLVFNRLPKPYHPVFNAAHFDRATVDRFFLCIESGDPKFDAEQTRTFLQSLDAEAVGEVPW